VFLRARYPSLRELEPMHQIRPGIGALLHGVTVDFLMDLDNLSAGIRERAQTGYGRALSERAQTKDLTREKWLQLRPKMKEWLQFPVQIL